MDTTESEHTPTHTHSVGPTGHFEKERTLPRWKGEGVCVHMCMSMSVWVCIYTCVFVHECVNVKACAGVSVFAVVRVCVSASVYVHMCECVPV